MTFSIHDKKKDPFAQRFAQLQPAQASGGTQVAPQQGPGLGQQVATKAAQGAIANQLGTAALTPVLGPAAPIAAPLISEFGGKAIGSLFGFQDGGPVKRPLLPLEGGDSEPVDPVTGGWNSFADVQNAFSSGYYGTTPDARAAAAAGNPKAQAYVDATDKTYADRAAKQDPAGLDIQPSANKIAPVGVLGLIGRGLQELGLQNAYGSGALGTNDPVVGNPNQTLSSETIAAGTNTGGDDGDHGFGGGFGDSGYGASEGEHGGVGDFNDGGLVGHRMPGGVLMDGATHKNMGGMMHYNAGGWVQARMKHLNHGGMAVEDAGMQAYNEMQGMTGEGVTMPNDPMPQGAMAPDMDFGYRPSGPLTIKDQMEIDKMQIQRGKAMTEEMRKDKAFQEGERRKEEAHKESMAQKKEKHEASKGPLA